MGGAKNWSIGTVAGGQLGDVVLAGADTFGGFAAWQGSGTELWLENCRDIGCLTGLYVDTAGGAIIRSKNHKGSGKKVGTISTF